MSVELPVVAPSRASWHRPVASAALLAAFALFAMNVAAFVEGAANAIRYPFELDYGEGIVWQQALRIVAGDAYGSIDQYPAIVFHYPPVFHLISMAAAEILGLDQLSTGRAVSLVSTVLMGCFAGLIVYRALDREADKVAAVLCGATGGLAVLTLWPVLVWAPLMRVDMAAMVFSLAGVFLGIAALRRPALIHGAALCFVAAVYTKQTSIAAPAATFLTLLLVSPKVARAGIATAMLTGLALLAALSWWTEGGFVRHIFLYNINRFEAWRLQWILNAMGTHSLYFGVAAIGIAYRIWTRLPAYRGASGRAIIKSRLAAAPADSAFILLLVYFLISTVMLITVAKSGSNLNYLIEWLCVLAILVGLSMKQAAVAITGSPVIPARPRAPSFIVTAILPIAVAVQAFMLPSMPDRRRGPIAEIQTLVTLMREAERPVISDDMVLLLRAGKTVEWEPAIFSELASGGIWDERPFVSLIRARHFAFFVTMGRRGSRLFNGRYSPAVADAIDAAYPVKRRLSRYTVHLPAPAGTGPR